MKKSLSFESRHFSILDEPTVMEIEVEFKSVTKSDYEFNTWIFDPDVERYRKIEEFPAAEQMAINSIAADWASKNAQDAYEQIILSAGDEEYERWRDRQMEERG